MAEQALVISQQPRVTVAAQSQEKLQSYLDAFLDGLDVMASSRATYGRQLRQWLAWLEETGRIEKIAELTREDILAYKRHLQGHGMSSLSVNGYLTAVRKFYAWLEAKKLYPNIARDIKGLKRPKGHAKDTLTEQQLQQALAGIDRSSLEGLRDYAIFNLMARTGLRDVEVARARIEDIRSEAGQPLLYIQGKGRDQADEFVLLLPPALKPIKAWLQARAKIMGKPQDGEPLFCSLSPRNFGQALTTRSISRLIKDAMLEIGLDDKRLTAHSLRHTAISLAVKGGASLHQAQAMARHSSPSTTMIYFHNFSRISQGAERCISF